MRGGFLSSKWWMSLLLVCAANWATAANINDVVRDTQWNVTQGARNMLVWWMPSEYFRMSFESQPGMTPSMVDPLIKSLDQYTIMAVIDVDIAGVGIVGGRDAAAVQAQLKLFDSQGKPLQLVETAAQHKDVRNLLAALKPSIAGMLGPMGEHLQFAVYAGQNADGVRLVNPTKSGSFSVEYAGLSHKWRLPLGSLLPNKVDATTGEIFPGDYLFNPYTGKKLP